MLRKSGLVLPVLLAAGFDLAGVYTLSDPGAAVGAAASVPAPGCTIKGNISTTSGERIYHLPGQRYYAETRISPEHGERWFCSEAEARSAGWRRSRV